MHGHLMRTEIGAPMHRSRRVHKACSQALPTHTLHEWAAHLKCRLALFLAFLCRRHLLV